MAVNSGAYCVENSGCNMLHSSAYSPIDTFNWRLLTEPSWGTTIWSISRAFRRFYGSIRYIYT
jgi:hypothetical protein